MLTTKQKYYFKINLSLQLMHCFVSEWFQPLKTHPKTSKSLTQTVFSPHLFKNMPPVIQPKSDEEEVKQPKKSPIQMFVDEEEKKMPKLAKMDNTTQLQADEDEEMLQAKTDKKNV